MAAGIEATFLGEVAESTFADLLRMWTGPRYPGPSQIAPDVQKIDLRHQMSALSGDLGNLPFSWQVKGTTKTPTVVRSDVIGASAFRVYLSDRYMRQLLDAAAEEPALYLALGIARCAPENLLAHEPVERFTWFAVDVGQYRNALGAEATPRHIDVPAHNQLNLGLFSLLWAARWVQAFFDPLCKDVRRPPEVSALLDSFDTELSALREQAVEFSEGVVPGLKAMSEELSQREYRRYASLLAITGSLRAISAKLLLSAGADHIHTYSPEALAGTVNLWLFARVYHEFMRATQLMADENVRLLPFKSSTLKDSPTPFFLAALFYVRELYRKLGAHVEIVQMLEEGGRHDHADFSRALREFNWVAVDDHGHIELSELQLSATGEDREILRVAGERSLTGVGLSLSGWTGFGGLSREQLQLELLPPTLLLPPEDRFLEYPTTLWTHGPRGFGV